VPRRLALVTGTAHEGLRLDDLLGQWLPPVIGRPLSRSAVRRVIMAGAVRVDGRPARRPGLVLAKKTRLEVALDPARLPPAPAPMARVDLRVLFEDEAVLAVDKPAGLPTHATADAARPHLIALVKAHLATEADPSPYLGVHQRLDRDTSGVVLFAKSLAANPGLARAFAERQVEKTYHALTVRPRSLPPSSWSVRGLLAPSGKRRMQTVATGGQDSETRFRLLESHPGGLLVEAAPLTGRKHQIRVHLADAGLPILGDDVYGAASARASRLMLHAVRLALPHPLNGKPLVVESKYPPDFADTLAGLKATRPAPVATQG
jgi:23S rRNA pseudouridine955/2504/2580 synthase